MPAVTKKPKSDEQAKAFRKAAREIGCEPDEKRFQDALRTVAKAKPSEKVQKPVRKDPNT